MNKVCSKCDTEFPECHFLAKRRVCRKCRAKIAKEKRKKMNEERDLGIANGGTKQCSKCKETKKYSEFNPGVAQCKVCRNKKSNKKRIERNRKKREELKNKKDTNETKTCSNCGKDHSILYFPIDSNQCNDCKNKKKRERMAKKRPQELKPSNENNKICKYCKKEQSKDNFRHNRRKCLDCERKDGREFRRSEHGKEKSKAWVENNRERMKELQANHYQNNKEKIYAKYIERYHSDYFFKLKVNLKSRLHSGLKLKGKTKSSRTMEYINCTLDDLIEWFKFCFDEKMSLENHGEYWHIDHVIPIATFEMESDKDVESCFSWYNLMPLKGKENMGKKDKIDEEQIESHIEKLQLFGFEIPKHYNDLCNFHTNYKSNNFISCKICKEEKEKTEFRKNRRKCKECEKKADREFRQSEQGKKKSKEWLEKNKDKMKQFQAEYYQNNKDKIMSKRKESYQQVEYRLKHLTSVSLKKALKKKNPTEKERKLKYLNCNANIIQKWIKYNSNNINLKKIDDSWNIERAIPINFFDLDKENEILLCFGWYNLIPSTDEKIQLKTHLRQLRNFAKENKLEIPEDYKQLCKKHLQNTTTNNIISNEML